MGDTVKAAGHDIEIKVRLVGIDAPETSKRKRDPGQPYSQKANKYHVAMILNNQYCDTKSRNLTVQRRYQAFV
jgi:endonuclease YncB( thermonuclease family)